MRKQMIERMTDTMPVRLRKRCAVAIIEPQHSFMKQPPQLFQQLAQLLIIDRSASIRFIQRITYRVLIITLYHHFVTYSPIVRAIAQITIPDECHDPPDMR